MNQPLTDKRQQSVDNKDPETEWSSIWIAAVLSFVGSVQFSLYFSALWPYLQILDFGMSETFFGATIALYSFGQILSSPFFGWWSNRIKQVRQPLCVGIYLMLAGNVIYILMETIHVFPKRYWLMIGRFITGMGSGNVAILRTYASTASTLKDRTKALAFVTCGQALGLTTGPVFQLLFTPLDHPGIRFFDLLSFSLYTAPAYFACLMNIGGLVLLYFFFNEKYAGIIEEDPKTDDVEDQSSIGAQPTPTLPPYDLVAILICHATRFCDMFVRTNLETLGSPFAMMMFSLDEAEAITAMSIAQGCVGALTFAVYIAYIFFKLDRFIQLRNGCIAALAALILFHLLTYAWPFLPETVELMSPMNGTDLDGGCNTDRFHWCGHLTSVNVWLYYGSYALIIGLSFPLLTITLNTLFSKVIGPRRQGTQQGLLQVSSGVARMVGPLSASALYAAKGPKPVWVMEIIVIAIILGAWLICYKRMVPLKIPEELCPSNDNTETPTKPPSGKIHPI